MFVKKTLAAAGLLAMTGAVAACGGGSSSAPAASGAAAAPTGAPTVTFCSTIAGLSNSTTPKQLGDKLQAVGTPSGIATNERHGFEETGVIQVGSSPPMWRRCGATRSSPTRSPSEVSSTTSTAGCWTSSSEETAQRPSPGTTEAGYDAR